MRQHPVPPVGTYQQEKYLQSLTPDLWNFNSTNPNLLPSLKAQWLEADIERAARNAHFDVLITGETGTGKTLAALQIHERSRRAGHPFKDINCAALPEHLFEAELYGYRKGAFTGADRDHAGLFEEAIGGTLFLDEIGEIPLAMQNKLLKAIEDKRIKRLGTNSYVECDIRIIAATSRDLTAMIESGAFREDLYCRLSVLQIETVPLRERREDIPALLDHFLRDAARMSERAQAFTIEREAVQLLLEFDFPGNIRRLRNMVYELTSYIVDDTPIKTEEVHRYINKLSTASHETDAPRRESTEGEIVVPPEICIIRHGESLREWEARVRRCGIEAARRKTGHLPAAAHRLGLTHSALKQHLRRAARRMDSSTPLEVGKRA
jgi:transcriptional regulator with PAS, ATPase and Fis domain